MMPKVEKLITAYFLGKLYLMFTNISRSRFAQAQSQGQGQDGEEKYFDLFERQFPTDIADYGDSDIRLCHGHRPFHI